jgi:hypothetical protein
MKNTFVIFLILFLTIKSFGQNNGSRTNIDELVSVNIPGKVEKFDTIIEKLKLSRFQSTEGDGYCAVVKMGIDSIKNQPYDFPYDMKTLEEDYRNLMADFIKQASASGLFASDSNLVKLDEFTGYQVRFKDSESGKINGQTLILLLNKNVYTLFYMDKMNYNETVKNDFFNSLTINKQSHPKQMIGESGKVKSTRKFGSYIGIVLVIFIVIYLTRKLKKKNTLYHP